LHPQHFPISKTEEFDLNIDDLFLHPQHFPISKTYNYITLTICMFLHPQHFPISKTTKTRKGVVTSFFVIMYIEITRGEKR